MHKSFGVTLKTCRATHHHNIREHELLYYRVVPARVVADAINIPTNATARHIQHTAQNAPFSLGLVLLVCQSPAREAIPVLCVCVMRLKITQFRMTKMTGVR